MSLPTAAVDRLFQRLFMTYGSEFERLWGKFEINEIKTMWAHELGSFANHLPAIGWALENLPDRCPNLIQFKNLCKQAPRPDMPRLDQPRADPDVVDAEIAKIASEALQAPKDEQGDVDHKRWAKKLQKHHEDGLAPKLSPIQIDFYQTALGIKPNPINV